MPTASTPQAEAERRSKISAALKGVPKGPRRPWNAEARARKSQSVRDYWADLTPEQKEEVGSKISGSLMEPTIARERGQKVCRKCRQSLSTEAFPKDSRNRDGSSGRCRQCLTEASQQWALQHPETIRAYRHNRYNIQFQELWTKQEGLCALCGGAMLLTGKGSKSVVIDHDHTCCPGNRASCCGSCVRGLLHSKCNLLLGLVEHNQPLLKQAQAYLARSTGRLS